MLTGRRAALCCAVLRRASCVCLAALLAHSAVRPLDARAKVRQLALLLVAGTQPVTNLKMRKYVQEVTGKEEEVKRWSQQRTNSAHHTTPNPTRTALPPQPPLTRTLRRCHCLSCAVPCVRSGEVHA